MTTSWVRAAGTLGCALALLAASASSAPPTPEEFANGRVAFVSTRDGTTEIYTMNRDGSEQTRLTVNQAEDYSPAWSPDGHTIAFASNRDSTEDDGDWDIYTIDASGGEGVDGYAVRRVVDMPGFDGSPSWSPDGTRIAFVSARDNNSEIYVMDAAGGANQTNVTNSSSDDAAPTFAPDSPVCGPYAGAIAFESDRGGNYDIYVVRRGPSGTWDASGIERITRDPAPDLDPSWAPDCSAIAYDSVHDGDYDVFTLSLSTRAPRNLTDAPGEDSRPSWSPDGGSIAFTSLRDGHYEIYTMDSYGAEEPVNLSLSYPSSDTQPAWQRVAASTQEAPPPLAQLVSAPRQAGYFRATRAAATPVPQGLACEIGTPPKVNTQHEILGNDSSNVICTSKTKNNQHVIAGAGRDTVKDKGGKNTVIEGGSGRDTLYSRDGRVDKIIGGPGTDNIFKDRADKVVGNDGDVIYP